MTVDCIRMAASDVQSRITSTWIGARMSEPLPHLDHRVSLFTKSDLLFIIVLLL